MKKKLLVITPIEHIAGLLEKLESKFEVTLVPDPTFNQIRQYLEHVNVVYTNPNKSKLPIDRKFMEASPNLEQIVTASTGTIHIDVRHAEEIGISVISLTREYSTINKISSTAEHAVALTFALLRNLYPAINDVSAGIWDYEKFIGRQMNALTVGVIGYGRLGKMYARFMEVFGAEILICDPFLDPDTCPYPLMDKETLFVRSNIISLHVHANEENLKMIDDVTLNFAKSDVMIVNTARGEVVDEEAMVQFLKKNPKAKLATDVLADELENKWKSPLLGYFKAGNESQLTITPHIGGMSREAQEIAYHRVADLLLARSS